MGTSRRAFLAAASASAARVLTGTPSDRIRIALIGAGGRGQDLFNDVRRSGENAEIVAVCDVWRTNREAVAARVQEAFGAAPRQTTRYEELLAMKDLDAVLIATPDFSHTKILTDAVAAGKDAYVEKPFAIEFSEAKRAYLDVQRSKQVVQVGTGMRSAPGMIGVAAALHGGAIGKVTRGSMEVHFQQPRWRRDYSMVKPEDVDWEAFCLGGRLRGPFDARRLRQWQLFRDTTNGIPGLWMSHYIDLAAWFLNIPYPNSAVALGGVYLWKDGRQTSDVFQATLEYGAAGAPGRLPRSSGASGTQETLSPEFLESEALVTFAMSLTNAAGNRHLWFGTRGTLDATALQITGDGSFDPNRVVAPRQIEKVPVESHMANFLRSIRSRQAPRADVQAGFAHAVAGSMAALSLETGRRVRFDAANLELL